MSNITYGIPQHQKRMPGKDKLRITITTLPDMQQLRVLIQFFLLHKQADRSQEHLFDVRQRNEGEQIKSHTQDLAVVYLKRAKESNPFFAIPNDAHRIRSFKRPFYRSLVRAYRCTKNDRSPYTRPEAFAVKVSNSDRRLPL